jgi:hypothetical protein
MNTRIIGGESAKPLEFAWIGSTQWFEGQQWCGASLLNVQMIILQHKLF